MIKRTRKSDLILDTERNRFIGGVWIRDRAREEKKGELERIGNLY